jgi:protein-L-isoaspartate(D-aspartate) O-methyltransferase
MTDYATQRANMVESQVRANDVPDHRIQDAMRIVPREQFVPATRRALSYADAAVEVVSGRFLLEPRCFAKLLQLAQVGPNEKILDVACATGYSTAVLARLAAKVTGLEEDADLVRVASDLASLIGANATVVQGSLVDGYKAKAPYDVIFVNGAIETRPNTLLAQLAEGGRLVTILKSGNESRAYIYQREHGAIGARADFDAETPMLMGFREKAGFVF